MVRTILITGTSKGIGLATAVELAKRGERVFASMRDLARADELLGCAAAAGVTVEVVQLDVTDSTSVTTAVRRILETDGRIDVLVNNAAIALSGPMEFATEDDVRTTFDSNVFGPLRVIQAVLPSMREQRSGRIVNISSSAVYSRFGHRLLGLYVASKRALSGLTEELCKEVAPFGIEVVLMEGGILGHTPMVKELDTRSASLDLSRSPYAKVERCFQIEWNESLRTVDNTPATARLVADAATVERPRFNFPSHQDDAIAWGRAVPDDAFVRLCALEASDDLAPYLYGFWASNVTLAQEAAAR